MEKENEEVPYVRNAGIYVYVCPFSECRSTSLSHQLLLHLFPVHRVPRGVVGEEVCHPRGKGPFDAAYSFYRRTAPMDGVRTALVGDSMRTDRYRLTHWHRRGDPEATVAVELYDHRADPFELLNLAEDPAYSEVVEELTRRARTRR